MMLLLFLMLMAWAGLRLLCAAEATRRPWQLAAARFWLDIDPQYRRRLRCHADHGAALALIGYGRLSDVSLVILGLLIRCSLESTGLIGGHSCEGEDAPPASMTEPRFEPGPGSASAFGSGATQQQLLDRPSPTRDL